MKRCLIFVLIITLVITFSGCKHLSKDKEDSASSKTSHSQSKKDARDDVVNITEKMYVSYINDIYYNADDYLGKTIKLEGMFLSENYPPDDMKYHHYVFRTGPGCCGNDGAMCGFEVTYDGELPKNNDWVEAVGVLTSYKNEKDGMEYLFLKLDQLKVLDTRGAETVYQ